MKRRFVPIVALFACLLTISSLLLSSCGKSEDPAAATPKPSKATGSGITYYLAKSASPTADELDAYTRITAAMDAACAMYNAQTNYGVTKYCYVTYNTGVATADGSTNGSIRFGANRSYMTQCTAMHEIAHTVGVGLSSGWTANIGSDYKWTGANALACIRGMVGESSSSTISTGGSHFWPYGLNYNSEWTTVTGQRHARIVAAMKADGM